MGLYFIVEYFVKCKTFGLDVKKIKPKTPQGCFTI